ncbi:MAG: S9 family peptidase [Oscillospiraceae bacterium]|jgi:acylaminoacyl-peptidase|nr:S9 family peptidase [Oscillospiraceae bacterium]
MHKLGLKDFTRYELLSGLQWAPGGARAALVVSRAQWDTNDYASDIWLMEPAAEAHGGWAFRRLTSGKDARRFFWLNDQEIIFPAMRDPKEKEQAKKGEKFTAFQKIGVDGGEALPFMRIPYTVSEIQPCDAPGLYALTVNWHPDDPDFTALDAAGKAAAFERIAEEKDYEVLEEIPFWSNGGGFTNKARTRLYLYDAGAGTGRFLTDPDTDAMDIRTQGDEIVYLANRFVGKREIATAAYAYHIAKDTTTTLLPQDAQGLRAGYIDFAEGGYVIAATDGKAHGNGQYEDLYLMKDGRLTLLKRLDEAMGNYTNSDCRYGGGTHIKLHEGWLYYTAVDHVDNALRRIALSDGRMETLLKQSDTIDGFDVGTGGLLFYGLGATTLHEVFALEGDQPVQLSAFNHDALADLTLTAPIRCDAMGEAATIEGFVIPPVDYQPGQRYPAILNIHGGPKTAYGASFFHENHLYAALGYFVLLCNPWGSDGRGDDFADLRGRYGTIDYNDLMAFTDQCLTAFPDIDPSRVCVTGGSYGGYMTNWIIGHTDRFVCAASQRSISNWISKFGTTDIGYFFNADQQQSTPWDNMEKMWWHSPMKYADRCVTPTLFIHSEEDYRCWLAEGLQMFTSLKYHGCEARLCMFRHENHELSRSGAPKHRARRLQELTDWFARFAGGARAGL